MPKAVITGASAGIGTALAKRLAREGYDLVLVARREERLRELATELERDHKIKAEFFKLDVTEPDAPKKLVERAGDADLLVNNAGYGKHGPTHEVPLEHATGMVRLNCEALTGIMQAFLPRMIERKRGTILNVASVAGTVAAGTSGLYSAAKHAQVAFSRCVTAELAPRGVRVVTVLPGFAETEGFPQRGVLPRALNPLIAEADDVARAIVRAVERDKREIVVPWYYRAAGIGQALLPGLIARVARSPRLAKPA